MLSHESIYGLLGTYMKERERYRLAPTAQLAGKKKKTLGFHELPRKNKQQQRARALSGKEQVTGPWCGNWKLLSEGSYVNRYSAVIPKTCGSCKNSPRPTNPHPPWTPATIQSHCPVDRETGMCFFLRVSPLGMMHVRVCVCVWETGAVITHSKWYWFRRGSSEWCCFSDKVLCQPCLIRY